MVERPQTTFQKFAANGLANLASESLRKDHIISVYKETNRLVDDYTYYIDSGGLFWLTEDDIPKKIYIKSVINRSNFTTKKEGDHFDKLESWSMSAWDGAALWFSPDSLTSYPCSKAILHKISYSIKKGFDTPIKSLAISSINIDIASSEIIKIMTKIFPNQKINSLEDLRSQMLTFNSDDELFLFIEEIYKHNLNIKNKVVTISPAELEKKAWYISKMFNSGYSSWEITEKMQEMDLLGRFSISCAGGSSITTTNLSYSNNITQSYDYSEQTLTWHIGTCRICNSQTLVGGCSICQPCVNRYF